MSQKRRCRVRFSSLEPTISTGSIPEHRPYRNLSSFGQKTSCLACEAGLAGKVERVKAKRLQAFSTNIFLERREKLMFRCKSCEKAMGKDYKRVFFASTDELWIDQFGYPLGYHNHERVRCPHCGKAVDWNDEAENDGHAIEAAQPF